MSLPNVVFYQLKPVTKVENLATNYRASGCIILILLISVPVVNSFYRQYVNKQEMKRTAIAYDLSRDMHTLDEIVSMYILDTGSLPNSLDELLSSRLFDDMSKREKDDLVTGPWGSKYIYEVLNDGDAYKITGFVKGDPKNGISYFVEGGR